MSGRVIVLIGTSSVGKSATARELQQRLTEPHLVVGLDDFFAMFPHHWAGHARGPGPGFWYDDLLDPDGRPRSRTRYGDAGVRLLAGMRRAVLALLDAGNDVILDEMPIDETVVPAWRTALEGYRAYWVLLTAPPDVVEQREVRRTQGRHLGNARGHLHLTAALDVDTSLGSPGEVAERILAAMAG